MKKQKYNFENSANFAAMELANIAEKNGVPVESVMQMMRSRASKGALVSNSNNDLAEALLKKVSAANFSLKVLRKTHTISEELPVPLFAPTHAISAYQKILGNYLPVGVSISGIQIGLFGTAVTLGDASKVVITYTDGVNSDDVEITTNGVPYPSHLMSLYNTIYKMDSITYKISDATKQGQFDSVFEPFSRTTFGKSIGNEMSVSFYESAFQLREGLVEINANISADSESGCILGIIDSGTDNFSVTLNANVSVFDRYGRALL